MDRRIKYRYYSAKPRFFFILGLAGVGLAIGGISWGMLTLLNLDSSVTPLESSISPVPSPSPVETSEAVETPSKRSKTPAEISNWAEWENPENADKPIVDPKP